MMEEEKLNFVISTLKIIYLWPENGQISGKYKLKNFCFMFLLNTTAFATLFGLIRSAFIEFDGYTALIDRVVTEIDYVGALYVRYYFLHNISKIYRLFEDLYSFRQFCAPSVLNETETKAKFLSKIFLSYTIFGNLMNCALTLLGRNHCIINGLRMDELHFQRDPCGLMARCFFPFDVNGIFFPLAYFGQIYTCLGISLLVVVPTLAALNLLMHIIDQILNCRKLILSLEHDKEPELIRGKILNVILYHIHIIEFSDRLNEAFGHMLMMHLAVPSLVIGALGFQVLIVDNYNDALRFTLHLFGWIILLLLVCSYGQILIDESVAVANDIYSIPWFEAPVDVQKNIYMILIRSQKPLTLTATNLGVMSLPTFMNIIRSAYSYLTLLLKVKH